MATEGPLLRAPASHLPAHNQRWQLATDTRETVKRADRSRPPPAVKPRAAASKQRTAAAAHRVPTANHSGKHSTDQKQKRTAPTARSKWGKTKPADLAEREAAGTHGTATTAALSLSGEQETERGGGRSRRERLTTTACR